MVSTGVSHGGEPRNRKDITTGHRDQNVTFYRTNFPPIFAGFQQEWVSGQDPDTGATFNFTSGAGWGNQYATLCVEREGLEPVYEYVDIIEVVEQRVRAILAEQVMGAPGQSVSVRVSRVARHVEQLCDKFADKSTYTKPERDAAVNALDAVLGFLYQLEGKGKYRLEGKSKEEKE